MSKCEVCGNHKFRRQEVEEVFHIDGRYVLVEHIPATVCLQCGEKTFDAETAESIRRLLHGQNKPQRSTVLEVFAF
ncbi:MAG TPA: YgiT-type zinc finger protein [Xanthomonadaceae bacterium]|nr:YgiT-type zinc finger protein [Xanthomonadaceae bacterium]